MFFKCQPGFFSDSSSCDFFDTSLFHDALVWKKKRRKKLQWHSYILFQVTLDSLLITKSHWFQVEELSEEALFEWRKTRLSSAK